MCGIAGLWFSRPPVESILQKRGAAMGAALAHRGPDAEGLWLDREEGLVFAHRRLSILDLSETGSQPMRSSSGRFIITYNGECYNFRELRAELENEGRRFRGQSDTEVILEGFEHWGIGRTLDRLNGMFAFAVWDATERRLFLARDRLGIKPLYYSQANGVFWFGSELKAIRAVPELQPRLDQRSLALFFKFGYIPAPHCIFERFRKLHAGHFLELADSVQQSEPICYYANTYDYRLGVTRRFAGEKEEAVEQLDSMLRKSVRQQMVSDVPLGAFLSGGVDSSTIVAMMQAQSSRPVKTFTIGFGEAELNEARSARTVSDYLGTEHTELILQPDEALRALPSIMENFDEPFGDASALPTSVVSQLARRQVTVNLSGDGGDELFAGYTHYPVNAARIRRIEKLPLIVRAAANATIMAVSEKNWDRVLNWAINDPCGLSGHKLRKYAAVVNNSDPQMQYELMTAHWFEPRDVLAIRGTNQPGRNRENGAALDPIDMMALWDLENYLPEDVLTKLDRTSMAVSLESRVPILDHEIVNFALDLPLSCKRAGEQGKWILREVLRRYVPKELTVGPKKGFAVPIGKWLRGPLRDWGEELLGESRLESQALLNVSQVRQKWREHLTGKRDWEKLLWPVVTFEAWSEHWRNAI